MGNREKGSERERERERKRKRERERKEGREELEVKKSGRGRGRGRGGRRGKVVFGQEDLSVTGILLCEPCLGLFHISET